MRNNQISQSIRGWDKIFKSGSSITKFPHEALVTCYYRWMKDRISHKTKKAVLDIGCGGATDLSLFLSEGIHYTGIDITDSLFELIKLRHPGYKRCYDLKLFEPPYLPFKNSYFDIVIGFQSIYFNSTNKSMQCMIKEIYRVLKLGGCFFFTTYHKDSFIFKNKHVDFVDQNIVRVKETYPQEERHGMHYFFFRNKKEIKTYFSRFSKVYVGKHLLDLDDGEIASWYLIYGEK